MSWVLFLDSGVVERRLGRDVDGDCQQLKGFEPAKPKQLYRKFVETGGQIETGRMRDPGDGNGHLGAPK